MHGYAFVLRELISLQHYTIGPRSRPYTWPRPSPKNTHVGLFNVCSEAQESRMAEIKTRLLYIFEDWVILNIVFVVINHHHHQQQQQQPGSSP